MRIALFRTVGLFFRKIPTVLLALETLPSTVRLKIAKVSKKCSAARLLNLLTNCARSTVELRVHSYPSNHLSIVKDLRPLKIKEVKAWLTSPSAILKALQAPVGKPVASAVKLPTCTPDK